jgi:hypothetical protein
MLGRLQKWCNNPVTFSNLLDVFAAMSWPMCIIVFAVVAYVALESLSARQPPGRQPIQPLIGSTAPAQGNRAGEASPATKAKAKALPTYLRLSGLRMGDADTFNADIHLPYAIVWSNRRIRVLGFDAYESSNARRTVEFVPDELERGKRATDDGWKCLYGADAVYIEATADVETTYDRILGAIWFDPPGESSELVNYGDWMRSRNHARPTDPELLKQAKEKK